MDMLELFRGQMMGGSSLGKHNLQMAWMVIGSRGRIEDLPIGPSSHSNDKLFPVQ